MTAQMEHLIIAAFEAEQASKANKAAQLQAQIEDAKARIAGTLGELWTELAPYADEGHHKTEGGALSMFWYVIEPPEMAAIAVLYTGRWLSTDRNPTGVYLTWSNIDYGTKVPATPDQMGAFLLDAKRAYLDRQAKERQERVDHLARKLEQDYHFALVPLGADQVQAELIELAPDRAAEWTELRQTWQAAYDQHRVDKALEAERKTLEAAYRVQYADYYRRYLEVREANRARLAEIRAVLAQPFRAWQLEYGVVAQDEEEGVYVDTRTVYVAYPEPDGGYWIVGNSWEGTERRKFYHLVSLSGPHMLIPSKECPVGRRGVSVYTPIGQHLGDVHFNPFELTHAQVEDMVNTALAAYPESPEPPEGLDQYAINRAQQNACQDAVDPDVEIPF